MDAALGVGRLTSLEVCNPSGGKSHVIRPKGKWLGWIPRKRQFIICTVLGPASEALPSTIAKAHRKFHCSPSRRAQRVEAPSPTGRLTQVGLVKALTYRVPKQVKSPGKNPYHWHHAFGDTGHKGGVYTPKVMPALCRDSKGNLFIRRRKGNIFTVDTWLRG